jgi:hypothetical protein
MTQVPLGLIVEGAGEFNALPNLVRKAFPAPYAPLPVVNAGGIGNIISNLEQLLVDLVRLRHPRRIIITLDKADVVGSLFSSCENLRVSLERRCEAWRKAHALNFGLHPLPDAIAIVVQNPRFEAWLTAGLPSFQAAQLTVPSFTLPRFADVDIAPLNHRDLLHRSLVGGYRKRPSEVTRLSKVLDPASASNLSRSFRKFMKEAAAAYE